MQRTHMHKRGRPPATWRLIAARADDAVLRYLQSVMAAHGVAERSAAAGLVLERAAAMGLFVESASMQILHRDAHEVAQ